MEVSGSKSVANVVDLRTKFSAVFSRYPVRTKAARFLEHSASRLNRKEIAKFRIPASAKVVDEVNRSCVRRLVTGMDSGGKKGSRARLRQLKKGCLGGARLAFESIVEELRRFAARMPPVDSATGSVCFPRSFSALAD